MPDSVLKHRSLTVQTIAFENDGDLLERNLVALQHAIIRAQSTEAVGRVAVRVGDCSTVPVLTLPTVQRLAHRFEAAGAFEYDFFAENLGHGGGHNRLAERADTDLILFANPDVTVSPDVIDILASRLVGDVGVVEPRQLPFEHPKFHDPHTGETGWVSGAFLMARRDVFAQVGGFDAASFFLYGDDVDLSWRIRAQGHLAVLVTDGYVFHDKRVDEFGVITSEAEHFYSTAASLMLAHKYSRPDIVTRVCTALAETADPVARRAYEGFIQLRDQGALPAPIDADHRVGYFGDGGYARARF